MVDFDSAINQAAAAARYGAMDKSTYTPPTQSQTSASGTGGTIDESMDVAADAESSPPLRSTWDPERGQVWEDPPYVSNEKDVTPKDESANVSPHSVQPTSDIDNLSARSVGQNDSYDLD